MSEQGVPATLANWQDPPFNRWGFLHVDEIVPTVSIGRDGAPTEPFVAAHRKVLDLPVTRTSGRVCTVADVLADTETDAFLVLNRGLLVHEDYPTTTADSRHLLMSVTKSFVGAVTGILAENGVLDLDGSIATYVPEVIGNGYDGATVRHLLDMRSGIAFSEAYLNPDSEIRTLEYLAGWRPSDAQAPRGSTYDYLARLPADRPHGGGFKYRSCETDMLGWVCERASGTDMATLLSELIWRKLGMEQDAYITVDLAGAAIHDGGLCATARDVARFGQLLLDNGRARSGAQVLPAWWTQDILVGAADAKDAFAHTSSFETGMPGGHYRHQLWVPFAGGRVLVALGIHGQMVYIDQATGTVGVKLSTWPLPQSSARFHDTLAAFGVISAHLATPDNSNPALAAPGNIDPGTANPVARGPIAARDPTGTALSSTPRPGDVMTATIHHALRNISEIRSFFRTNDEPVYFVGPTAFNLLGLDRWVRHFNYITYYDAWDGAHPRMITPKYGREAEFTSSEDIVNFLLRHPEVQARIKADGGSRPRIAAVFFDEETEAICAELGYELILPSHALRTHLDSKITTTRLGNDAGAPSVPNVLAVATDYPNLLQIADIAGLGDDLVIQMPYGDSGKTTFFVADEAGWDRHSEAIAGHEAKIMKRINRNTAIAVEAVITRHGTIVGPFMVDLTGYHELTPYHGGWCGNDLFPAALSPDHRVKAVDLIRRLGGRLGEEGYKGFFEVDIIVDLEADEVYLGELNPRISGASSMTNVTAGAYADLPLFLFHLLEYMDVDYTIDVDEINERWLELAAVDVWSQLVMKEPTGPVELILAAPRTGQYKLETDGSITFQRPAWDWFGLQDETEFFFLRVYGPGDYRFKGADLGQLVTKGRLQTDDDPKLLNDRCQTLIAGIRSLFVSRPINQPVAPVPMISLKGAGL